MTLILRDIASFVSIAAFVATSPCVGSRGGSAVMRCSAPPAASTPAAPITDSTAAWIRCSNTLKRFMKNPAAATEFPRYFRRIDRA